MRNFQVGDLLVASSLVEGTILNQAVCLLVHEDEEHVVGVMLNRPMRTIHASELPEDALPEHATGPEKLPPPSPPPKPASGHHRLKGMVGMSGTDQAAQTGVPASDALSEAASAESDGDSAQSSGDAASGENGPSPGPIQPKPPTEVIAVIGQDQDSPTGKMVQGASLHFGGPLAGPVVAVHGAADLGEAETGQGVYVAAQRDHLESLILSSPSPFRLIIGHLGWSHEQLDNEITDGVWHAIPATADVLATDDASLWPSLIRRATCNSVARWIGAPDAPGAAELN